MKAANLEMQYRKFPEIKRDEVLKLVDWIRAQPHMEELPEGEVILFYYTSEYGMQMAKRMIDNFLTMFTHCPEFFSNFDVEREELKRAMRTIGVVPLNKTTPEGYQVIISKLTDTDPSNYNFADTSKLFVMVATHWMIENGLQPGYICVIDLKGCSLSHMARVGIMLMKKLIYFIQDAAPLRLVGIHFVNTVPFMDKILALISPFLNQKMQSVLQLHNNLENFYKIIPKEILPKDYGGPDADIMTNKEIYYKKLRESRQELLEYERIHKINEKNRPGKPKDASNLYGVEGNFKKLDID